jgi:hypothetical protein
VAATLILQSFMEKQATGSGKQGTEKRRDGEPVGDEDDEA